MSSGPHRRALLGAPTGELPGVGWPSGMMTVSVRIPQVLKHVPWTKAVKLIFLMII